MSISENGKQCIGVGITRVVNNQVRPIVAPVMIRITSAVGPLAFRICREGDASSYFDRGLNFRPSAIRTSDVDIVNGRVRRLWIREHRPKDNIDGFDAEYLPCDIHWWFDGKHGHLAADEVSSFAGGTMDTGPFIEIEVAPARQKCNQVRFCWIEKPSPISTPGYGMSTHVLGIDMELIPAVTGRGAIRNATGNWRAS
jgi:hypothetical protein